MDETEIKAALAKYRKNIEISGKAMIVFAIWSLAKILLPFISDMFFASFGSLVATLHASGQSKEILAF